MIGCAACASGFPGWAAELDAAGVQRLRRCECWSSRHSIADGVPPEFVGVNLDTWGSAHPHALDAARRFVVGSDRDLYLCGPVGVGKTRLACAVLAEIYRDQRVGIFRRIPKLLLEWQEHGAADQDAVGPIVGAPVCVLDDIGAERATATDYTRRTLLMVAEARRDAGHRTIWTSNLTPAALGKHQADDRLMSRLVGWCDVIGMAGPDRRLDR